MIGVVQWRQREEKGEVTKEADGGRVKVEEKRRWLEREPWGNQKLVES